MLNKFIFLFKNAFKIKENQFIPLAVSFDL